MAVIGLCQDGVGATELPWRQASFKSGGFDTAFLSPAGSVDGPTDAHVLMMTSGVDPKVSDDDRRRLMDELRRTGSDWRLHVFVGACHSYTNRAVDALNLHVLGYDTVTGRGR